MTNLPEYSLPLDRLAAFYRGKRVLVTGHTGFKGAWLTRWLTRMGAEVWGYSLAPDTEPCLHSQLRSLGRAEKIADVRDQKSLESWVAESRADVLFHCAAQPLVRRSYREPRLTFETNFNGTVNLLEAVRMGKPHPCSVVIVTTDKCYENQGWTYSYRETDPLGGYDPYSASKATAEIATAAYRNSFFQTGEVAVASARAGNVIGGGDWSEDRIIPDIVRAISNRKPIVLRNPQMVRPWQHVLEPLYGYLLIGMKLHTPETRSVAASSWNIGPNHDARVNVGTLTRKFLSFSEIPEHPVDIQAPPSDQANWKETKHLFLSSEKLMGAFGWAPVWSFDTCLRKTAEWYSGYAKGVSAEELCDRDIEAFGNDLNRQAPANGV